MVSLNKDKISIWLIESTNQNYKIALESLKILSPKEIARWSDFKFKKNKATFLISHIALRNILSLYTKIKPEEIDFSFTNYNKPFLTHFPKLHFNLSHSHEKTLLAISQEAIGVDIEYIDRKLRYMDIVENFFSLEETNLIKSIPDYLIKRTKFFEIWTQKESLLKALGIGLYGNTKAINFRTFNKSDKSFVDFNPNCWHLRALELKNANYIGSIGYHSHEHKFLDYSEWSFQN